MEVCIFCFDLEFVISIFVCFSAIYRLNREYPVVKIPPPPPPNHNRISNGPNHNVIKHIQSNLHFSIFLSADVDYADRLNAPVSWQSTPYPFGSEMLKLAGPLGHGGGGGGGPGGWGWGRRKSLILILRRRGEFL